MDGATVEDARLYSLPGKELKSAMPLSFVDGMVDLGRLTRHEPAKSIAVVRGVFEAEDEGDMIIGCGADWWLHGFINGKPFGDTAATGNGSHPIGRLDQLYMARVQKGTNIITFYLRAGNNWHFGVTLLPLQPEFPRNYRIMNRINAFILNGEFRLVRAPLLFDVSTDEANVCVEFSLPAVCGITYTPANGGKSVTRWNKIYGQRDYRQIHHFQLTGLTAGTTYNYEILRQDETAGTETAIFTGQFTTFPANAAEHRFAVFSDTQTPTNIKRQGFEDFIANTPLKEADFIVSLGDMASGFGNFSDAYFTDFIDILKARKITAPLAMVRGNHELWGAESLLYSRFFGRPYGAFTYGDTFYIRLDSGEDQPRKLAPRNVTQKSDFQEYFAEEAAWLEKVIATPECRNAKRRIVLAHATPFELHEKHMANSLEKMLGKLFYGENPLCKIDLWIAGHIHYPMRFDPVAGKVYGDISPKKSFALTEKDRQQIRFPVYTNDGPRGGGAEISMLDVTCMENGILIRYILPNGKIVDEVMIRPGREIEVKYSEFKLLWSK